MKTVFRNSSEVIHIFAQRTQEQGRCSNVFFDRNCIYSYGRYYLLGEFITNEAGQEAIMINDRGCSKTTAEHISEIYAGTRQYKQFFTQSTEPRAVKEELELLASKFSKAKKPELYSIPAESLYEKYISYRQWSGRCDEYFHLYIIELIELFRGKKYAEYLAEQNERIKRAQEAQAKKEAERLAKELKEFFAYKRDSLYNSSEDYVRLSADKKSVETSQRVTVGVKEAKVLYSMIKAGRDIKGHTIDGWTVIGLNGTLHIGCHYINTKNMKQIGEKILKLA